MGVDQGDNLLKILIVDDSQTARYYVLNCLNEKLKYKETLQAGDGEEALAIYRECIEQKSPIDLIFLDVNMPKKDGVEVLEEIRGYEDNAGINDHVKVIMVTTEKEAKNIIGAFIKGADGYATKPFNEEDIMKAMLLTYGDELKQKYMFDS